MKTTFLRGPLRRLATGRKGSKLGYTQPYYCLYSRTGACCAERRQCWRVAAAPWASRPTRALPARLPRSGRRASRGSGGKEPRRLPGRGRTVTSFLSSAYAGRPLVLLWCWPASVVVVMLCVPRQDAASVPPGGLVLAPLHCGLVPGWFSRKIHLKDARNI